MQQIQQDFWNRTLAAFHDTHELLGNHAIIKNEQFILTLKLVSERNNRCLDLIHIRITNKCNMLLEDYIPIPCGKDKAIALQDGIWYNFTSSGMATYSHLPTTLELMAVTDVVRRYINLYK